MPKYLALLRGITMIGSRSFDMADVKVAFERLGYHQVKTIGNRGNVVFETPQTDVRKITRDAEKGLASIAGSAIGVSVRNLSEIKAMIAANPFKRVKADASTKLLVTFLSGKSGNQLRAPFESPDGDFKILAVAPDAVYSVAIHSPGQRGTGLLRLLEKQFGKEIATRNWSTILKIADD
jgi:uncharacterized protein (DUF1697 family)